MTSRVSINLVRGPRGAAGLLLAAMALLLTGLVAVEWYCRFARYHWEMQLLHLPSRPRLTVEAAPTFMRQDVPARQGGDLSALIGFHRAAEPYMEWREAGTRIVDPNGYVNPEAPPGVRPMATVVGDSFMAVGRMEDMFATRLAEQTGGYVYNRALMGHGPFVSVERYLDDPEHRDRPPAFLVWGFAEREVTGPSFERFYYSIGWLAQRAQASEAGQPAAGSTERVYVHWKSFRPEQLKKSLPATSLLAQTSQWTWNRLRFLLFGRLHPDLIPGARDVIDGPMLFYRHHVESIRIPAGERNLPMATKAIMELDALCRSRGIQLIVALIPEKEQVYREWLPDQAIAAGPLPPSSLWELEAALREREVPVVNLLRVFQDATRQGIRLYWRDDTHWNPAAVRLAAREVHAVIAGPATRETGTN